MFSVLSATKKRTQASPLPLIIRVLSVFRGRKKEVIYHGTHEIHGCRSAQKETSGHFFADHWTDATDALAKEKNNGPTSVFSALSATKKCTQASPLPLIIRALRVFSGRKTNEISSQTKAVSDPNSVHLTLRSTSSPL